MQLTVVKQDITTVSADAIVHPTNGHFAMLGEVGQALERVGGKKLVQEVSDVHKKTGTLAPCDGMDLFDLSFVASKSNCF